ncbi:hypothetical protein V8C86DRAFT_2513588 [Haematococcus lacustris]
MQANIQRFAAKKEDAPTPTTGQGQQDRKECQHTGQHANNTKPGRQCSSASLLSLLGSSGETSCKAAPKQGNIFAATSSAKASFRHSVLSGAPDKSRKRCRDEPLPPSSRRVHESHKDSGAGAAKRPLIPCSTQPAVFVLGADRSEVQRSRHRHPAQQQPHIGYFNHWADGNGTWDHDSIGIDGVKEGELGWQTHGAAALSSGFGPR